MIATHQYVLAGRHEPIKDESPGLWHWLSENASWFPRAKNCSPDAYMMTMAYNAMLAVGPYGDWCYMDLLCIERLGEHPAPYVGDRLRVDLGTGEVSFFKAEADPVVMFGASALLTERRWPVRLPGTDGRYPKARLEEAERALAKEGYFLHGPEYRRANFVRSLDERSLSLVPPRTPLPGKAATSAAWQVIWDHPDKPDPYQETWSTFRAA